LIYDVIAWL